MNHKTYLVAAALLIGSAAGAQGDRSGADVQNHNFNPASAWSHRNCSDVESDIHVARQEPALFAEALQLYRGGRWSAAYGRFASLADRGHADAARIAMLMLRYGSELYQTEWSAAPSQLEQWERAAGTCSTFQVKVSGE